MASAPAFGSGDSFEKALLSAAARSCPPEATSRRVAAGGGSAWPVQRDTAREPDRADARRSMRVPTAARSANALSRSDDPTAAWHAQPAPLGEVPGPFSPSPTPSPDVAVG